jgi:hypothetical protein
VENHFVFRQIIAILAHPFFVQFFIIKQIISFQ